MLAVEVVTVPDDAFQQPRQALALLAEGGLPAGFQESGARAVSHAVALALLGIIKPRQQRLPQSVGLAAVVVHGAKVGGQPQFERKRTRHAENEAVERADAEAMRLV